MNFRDEASKVDQIQCHKCGKFYHEYCDSKDYCHCTRLKSREPRRVKFSESRPATRDALARRGELICDSCDGAMDMYYKPWCPKCDVPKIEFHPSINFIQVLKHLEALGHKGIKDRVWKFYQHELRNDSSFSVYFGSSDLTPDELTLKEFLKVDSIVFDVSW